DSPAISGRWVVLALVAMDYFILYAHRNLLAYLQKPLTAELDLSKDQFGWLGVAFYLPYALAQIGAGYLGDRFQRRRVILLSLVGSVVALAAMGCVRNFAEIVALRVVLGIAQSASVPAVASALADSFVPERRSTAVGLYFMSYNL